MHFSTQLIAQRQIVSLCRTGKNHLRTTYSMKFTLSGILDVNGSTVSTDEIADYLLRKITCGRTNGQAANDSVYLIPHSSKPVNEYFNPKLLASLYPTLFCYGRGAPEDQSRPLEVRLREHVRYLLSYSDRRFEKHPSFMFVVFNLLQRRDACFHAQLIATRPYFRASANEIQSLNTKDIEIALDSIGKNSYSSRSDSKLNKLMHYLKTIGGRVMGSAYSRTALRTQIHALIFNQGLPGIFLTVNPADIHSPVALYFAGVKLDLDNIQTEQLMTTYKRAEIIASHPVATAKFFHLLITNILETMIVGGVLGPIKAYFGTVESQGRGSLHLHLLIWLDHEMKPSDMKDKVHDSDFREKLKAYLEDIIEEDLDQFEDKLVLECSDGNENIFHINMIFSVHSSRKINKQINTVIPRTNIHATRVLLLWQALERTENEFTEPDQHWRDRQPLHLLLL